ncbi:hypothetical protein OS242_05525 [Tumebacillus sp. DT12]|uniref:Uncharacterized protein n=1 Tax=Tumebacillus lacus TaxID=2995335 RepID=A0ABT3WXL0_9BACL|nr:hypothetical protein [Tumebacillus lacus]MCX7569413.1 hypothetical protein [Tumebacillus lacus]
MPLLEGPLRLENGWQTAFFQGENGEVLELLKRADSVSMWNVTTG